MSTTAEKIAVMTHYENGGKIQVRIAGDPNWNDWLFPGPPIWNWLKSDYRIKPEPVGPKEIWINVYKDGNVFHSSKENADKDALSDRLACVRFIRVDD